ncbi:hypothetical protein AKO1_013673 [Acrasis kona]|uniref:Dienelactone hydrolase domain-containing protein n=1 Tax=Acrasis kona TaxID=1008807 RepID=A0AAW2YKU5_9EUKA
MDATLLIQTIGIFTFFYFLIQIFARPPIKKCCVVGTTIEGDKKGSMTHINGVDAYISMPKNKSERAVVFLSDAFGLELINNYIICDKFAEAGYITIMPDLFNGGAIPGSLMSIISADTSKLSLLEKANRLFKMVASFGPFTIRHMDAAKKLPIVQDTIKELQTQHGITKIAATGYCYGGKLVALMNQHDINFDTSAVAHPSMLKVPYDIERIKKPILFNCAEEDFMLSTKAANESEAILKKNNVVNKFIHYPGTTHGFAVKPKPNEPKDAMDKCFQNTVDFFNETM